MRPVGVRVRTGAVSVSDRRSRLRDAVLELAARRTLLMGIVNLTPDSFSDGGRVEGAEAALQAALDLVREGADIIDLGGESTRPGAPPVSQDEELARVLEPVRLVCETLDHPVSIPEGGGSRRRDHQRHLGRDARRGHDARGRRDEIGHLRHVQPGRR